jgi:hypothetical protein
MSLEDSKFQANYGAVIYLADVKAFHVAGTENMQQYLDYFFGQFPIAGYDYNAKRNCVHVWGNRWPVETVIDLLAQYTLDVDRLS